jgi:hypothetical protein
MRRNGCSDAGGLQRPALHAIFRSELVYTVRAPRRPPNSRRLTTAGRGNSPYSFSVAPLSAPYRMSHPADAIVAMRSWCSFHGLATFTNRHSPDFRVVARPGSLLRASWATVNRALPGGDAYRQGVRPLSTHLSPLGCAVGQWPEKGARPEDHDSNDEWLFRDRKPVVRSEVGRRLHSADSGPSCGRRRLQGSNTSTFIRLP